MNKEEFLHIQLAKKYHKQLKKRLEEIEKNSKSKTETQDDNVRLGRNDIQTSR